MYDYLTKGYSQYGAQMGRKSDLPEGFSGILYLRKVSIGSDGYDPGGAYWGTGNDLYCIFDDEGRTFYTRAKTPYSAVSHFPNATFFPITKVTEGDISEMTSAYIEAALFTTTDEEVYEETGNDACLDAKYSESDLSSETTVSMHMACKAFAEENTFTILAAMKADPNKSWSDVGHDFWMTRTNQGCGFSDGDWAEPYATTLTEACKRNQFHGELYADDGIIRGHD